MAGGAGGGERGAVGRPPVHVRQALDLGCGSREAVLRRRIREPRPDGRLVRRIQREAFQPPRTARGQLERHQRVAIILDGGRQHRLSCRRRHHFDFPDGSRRLHADEGLFILVMPAKAGIHRAAEPWIPACAGMTKCFSPITPAPRSCPSPSCGRPCRTRCRASRPRRRSPAPTPISVETPPPPPPTASPPPPPPCCSPTAPPPHCSTAP